jgi:hypothetical protein
MSLILNGTWENSYGSTMTLDVSNDGFILGEYGSHTGSTGTYIVVGYCRPINPVQDASQPLVLSIYWRSTGDEEPDDGSHWVSTYCGQLDFNGQMTVMNSLVTTTQYQDFESGDYIDKLIFTKRSSSVLIFSVDKMKSITQKKVEVANPINGSWQDAEQQIQLTVSLQNQRYGFIEGWLSYSNERVKICGFTDTLPRQNNNILQSVSLSGYMMVHGQPISLVGRISQDTRALVLSRWLANSTTTDESFFQASSMNWRLSKQP